MVRKLNSGTPAPAKKKVQHQPTPEELIQERKDVSVEIKELEARKADIDALLMSMLQDLGAKSLTYRNTGKVTLVAPVRSILDPDKLKKRLTAAQWKKITTMQLDKVKLETALVEGTVGADDVAFATDEVKVKPHLRIS